MYNKKLFNEVPVNKQYMPIRWSYRLQVSKILEDHGLRRALYFAIAFYFSPYYRNMYWEFSTLNEHFFITFATPESFKELFISPIVSADRALMEHMYSTRKSTGKARESLAFYN